MTLLPLAFARVDWWIVGFYLLVATLPGFFCRRYIHGQDDFLVAGRTLRFWLATATLTATEMGLITVMYMAQMGYVSGLSAMVLGVIAFGATLFVGLTGFMVAGLRRSGVTTVAEFYEQRFSRGVRVLGGFIIASAGILNYGVFLKVEADFIRLVTQVPDLYVSFGAGGTIHHVPSVNLVMSILVVIVLLYTLLGGMVSVALTDYIQFIVLTLGLGAVTWWLLAREPAVGGFAGIIEAVRVHRPDYGLNPTIKTTAAGIGWVWITWQCLHWLGTNAWQTQAFRTAATDSPRSARIMWSLTAVNYFGRAVIPMLWGAAAIAFLYHTLGSGAAEINTLEAMPRMLAQSLPAGLAGFMVAGMLAALMSTHSSYLLAWSGVLTEDLVVPIARAARISLRPGTRIWITRGFILCLGGFLIKFGLWYEFKQEVWGYLGVTGTMYIAGAMSLIAMGLYWPRASTGGAYLGLIFGSAPGLVYLTTRFMVLAENNGSLTLPAFVHKVHDFMTDPVTGIMSYPLAVAGMILGSMLLPRGESDRCSLQVQPAGGAP